MKPMYNLMVDKSLRPQKSSSYVGMEKLSKKNPQDENSKENSSNHGSTISSIKRIFGVGYSDVRDSAETTPNKTLYDRVFDSNFVLETPRNEHSVDWSSASLDNVQKEKKKAERIAKADAEKI